MKKNFHMKNSIKISLLCIILSVILFSCKNENTDEVPAPVEPKLVFKFKFDSMQVRLNGQGTPTTVPAGHGAQSPRFNKMSVHYIELAQTAYTALGSGKVLYRNAEVNTGGSAAIDFSQSTFAGDGETFFSVPLKEVVAENYQYLRVSLAYQNYDINFRTTVSTMNYDLTGTIASFIGFNTYITNYKIKDSTLVVNDDRLQGYWAFEVHSPLIALPQYVFSGQAPAGATTVPNPLFATSGIPAGSCVVTGAFTNGSANSPLVITGNETKDVLITVSLSTNKSFEWTEHSTIGYFEPAAGDTVVDMGIRGLIPIVTP